MSAGRRATPSRYLHIRRGLVAYASVAATTPGPARRCRCNTGRTASSLRAAYRWTVPVRWVLLLATVALVVGLLATTQHNGSGQACGDVTALILLSPDYRDGESGGYPDEDETCSRAARRRGAIALAVALLGGTGTWLSFRRRPGGERAS